MTTGAQGRERVARTHMFEAFHVCNLSDAFHVSVGAILSPADWLATWTPAL